MSSSIQAGFTPKRLLVVEDEEEIRELITLHLKREGHQVDAVATVEAAMPLLQTTSYQLAAVDWMLPGASGVELTKRLRKDPKHGDVAILMITARTDAGDIVEGLDAGADDYLSKPFEPSVLIARVRALLRRRSRTAPPEMEGDAQLVSAGGLSLYPETYEAKCMGEPVQLTRSEFKLLLTLIGNKGRVLTRDSLIQHVQGEGVSVVGRTVDTHVFGLRKKLGACSEIIETVRGIGYRVKPTLEA